MQKLEFHLIFGFGRSKFKEGPQIRMSMFRINLMIIGVPNVDPQPFHHLQSNISTTSRLTSRNEGFHYHFHYHHGEVCPKLGNPPNCYVLACLSIISLMEKIPFWGGGDCHFQTHFHIEFMLLVIPQAILKPIDMTHMIYISDYIRGYSIYPRVLSSSFSWRRNSAVTSTLAPLSATDLVESWPR